MSCRTNGRTFVNYLTPAPGGTATSASYNLGLTHYTCGNKKMCVNSAEGFPVASGLDVQVISAPRLLGNGQYCCDVRCICDVTYRQICGCGCQNDCLQTEKVVATVCVPCGETAPTAVANGVDVSPVNVNCGCSSTNEMDVTVSFTLNTAAAAETGAKGK